MLLLSIPSQSALAALVETETVLEMSRAEDARDYVKQVLAREEVKSALIVQGADPFEAMARVDSLTDSEVMQLADQIEHLPAGGDALGLVIVVLVIVILVLVIVRLL
jgi:hypothetical protein